MKNSSSARQCDRSCIEWQMPHGAFRRVFLAGTFAFKVPRPRWLRYGMQCNRWEREVWRVWRLKFEWENLCPILWADPFGFLVVMARAEQPITQAEVEAALPDYYPDHDAEPKADSYGRLNGSLVALDYGLAGSDDIAKRRAYYEEKARSR